MENWKDIKGYEGLYQVSDKGNVASLNYRGTGEKRQLRAGVLPSGYPIVVLSDGKAQATKYVHRLVAEAFIENPDGKTQINHIDGCKTNNDVTNLEWATPSENMKHACQTGLSNTMPAWKASVEKSRHPVAKMDLNGDMLGVYSSLSEAARENAIHRDSITSAARGMRRTAGGYLWKFIEKAEVRHGSMAGA